MTQKSSLVLDTTSVTPQVCREGDAIAFKIKVNGVVTGITSPGSTFYKENATTDLAGTYLTGSESISGVDVIITKTTQGLKAGFYIWSVNGTVDGLAQNVATIPITVKRRSER